MTDGDVREGGGALVSTINASTRSPINLIVVDPAVLESNAATVLHVHAAAVPIHGDVSTDATVAESGIATALNVDSTAVRRGGVPQGGLRVVFSDDAVDYARTAGVGDGDAAAVRSQSIPNGEPLYDGSGSLSALKDEAAKVCYS